MKKIKIHLITIFFIMNLFSVFVFDQILQSNPVILANINSQQVGTKTLIVGKTVLFNSLDPAQAWGGDSYELISQVSEGLFAYDLFDPETEIIPRLASDYGIWNENATEFTVPLRQDVTFHNGYAFNASVVKFTFDRIDNLINLSLIITESLFTRIGDPTERLINRTIVIDPYTIKFVLNYPFLSFLPLLCFGATSIVEEHSVPWDSLLEDNDTLIGTGPYQYISYDEEEVKFEYYPDYYREIPEIEEIIYKKYDTNEEIAQALLTGDIHFSDNIDVDNLEDFIASDEIMVDGYQVKATTYFLGMNNEHLNTTIRRAINYAIDYDYIITELYENRMVRMTSIIPPGILYHKDTDVPTLDVSISRQILINAGLSKGLTMNSVDSDWIDLSFSDPIVIANYTYFHTSGINRRENIGYSIEESLRYIGISVRMDGLQFSEYFLKLYTNPDELDLFFIGWAPDYNDPNNFINSLFGNNSGSNLFQVNNPWLEQKMNESLYQNDESIRRDMFYQMQDYIALNLMPIALIGYTTSPKVHSYEIKNIPFNPLDVLYFYPCKWDPDTDGDGIIDSKEISIYLTDSNDNDTDNDGLSDGEEINTYFTNPNELDSDEDSIPDGWEVFYGLNPLFDDSSRDIDNDGLSNLEEYIYTTDPNDSDSDNDTLLDGEEVVLGSDGYVTDPNDPDSDDDTFNDGVEAEKGTNPLDPHSFPTFWTEYSEQIWQIGFGIAGALATAIFGVIFTKRKKKKKRKNIPPGDLATAIIWRNLFEEEKKE